MNGKISGTLAQLSGKVRVNGKVLTAPQLSALTTLGIGRKVGVVPKSNPHQRGREASVWEFDSDAVLAFESVEQ